MATPAPGPSRLLMPGGAYTSYARGPLGFEVAELLGLHDRQLRGLPQPAAR